MPEIVIGGTYQHYQGGIAKVICVAKHTESVEDLVVYEYTYPENDTKHPFHYPFRARPQAMFLEEVAYQGKTIPRFTLIKNAEEQAG
ncbi:MAG: DUF1653 domain-containing protein [Candidatus Peribacteria bacterium]|jgi:hypothetical protein|nr:DUF1653 domain-containing protein [Candidatus Peribacteria bacterium]